MPELEDRINALAKYLEVDPSTITESGDNLFETEYDGEYFVGDHDEAEELARDYIESLVNEEGVGVFTPDFQDWIVNNACKTSWFEDACKESYDNYAYDIQSEEDEEYGTRLAAECVENELISEEDFEDGQYVGDEDLAELLSQYLFDQVDDCVEWFRDNFGEREFDEFVVENNLLDVDHIVNECILLDGIAHFVASYDGEEIELDNDLYAYRVN